MSARFRIPSLTEIEYVQEDDPCVIRPFSAATVPPLKDEVPHRHDFQTIMWTWTGSSTHLIDNQLITSSPGTIHIIARGQVHLFVAVSSDFTGHFVRFEDDFLPEVSAPAIKNYRQSLFSGRRSGQLLQMEQKEAPAYQTLLAEMEEEFNNPDLFAQQDTLRYFLCVLLLRLERSFRRAMPQPEIPLSITSSFQDFISMVEDSFMAEHQVSYYANALYLTPGQLTSISKQAVGKTAKQVIADRVMVEAKRKLQFTNLTVKEIAFALGYVSPFYFTQAFTRRSGMSPSEYRSQFRQPNL